MKWTLPFLSFGEEKKPRNVMVFVDDSESADQALRWALGAGLVNKRKVRHCFVAATRHCATRPSRS